MTASGLRRELEERARRAGFDSVAVAAAGRLERDGEALATWLGRGRQADMAWMAREPDRRADPRALVPDCRSVVALAMNYWPGERPAATADGRARVALYAQGRDYHRVLGGPLRELAEWLEAETGRRSRAFVDTGPVLERAWAERAGLGWIGKNANLLTRELGSWLLLGEILTAAEIAPDPGPHEDFCGSCTACLDACPTGAIVEPRTVDANLCISYWTIEHRGPIPEERRPGLGEWIFGCDVCQDVCPWNRSFAVPEPGDRFGRRQDLDGLDPEEILALDEAAFRARYSGTALMRAKWEGMRRNACIVLGNRGRPEALGSLALALEDGDPVVRSHAAWAVRSIGGRRALGLLERAQAVETDAAVLDEIAAGIDALGPGV